MIRSKGLSSNGITRRDFFRRLIRKHAALCDVTISHLARATGRDQREFDRLLQDGALKSLPMADVIVLARELGPAFLDEMLAGLGLRTVPAEEGSAATDLVTAVMTDAKESADLVVAVVQANADGVIDSAEFAGIEREGGESVRATLAVIESARARTLAARKGRA